MPRLALQCNDAIVCKSSSNVKEQQLSRQETTFAGAYVTSFDRRVFNCPVIDNHTALSLSCDAVETLSAGDRLPEADVCKPSKLRMFCSVCSCHDKG